MALCVIAATTFWFFSALNKSDYTTQINYPITFSYPTDSTYLLSQLPENIRVQVNGGGWNLLRTTLTLNTPPIEVTLDEPTRIDYITGQSLTDKVRATLGDVRVDRIITDTLRINIDSTLEKTVTLAVDSTTIDLEENYWITSSVSLTPRTVKLMGPASVINQVPDTLPIELPDQEIDEDYEATVPLHYVNTMAEIVPPEANVRFRVANFVPLSQRVPIAMLNFPPDSSVYLPQDQADVNFWVKESLADQLPEDSIFFRVVANYNNASSDSTLSLTVSKRPNFARKVTVVPGNVKLRYAP